MVLTVEDDESILQDLAENHESLIKYTNMFYVHEWAESALSDVATKYAEKVGSSKFCFLCSKISAWFHQRRDNGRWFNLSPSYPSVDIFSLLAVFMVKKAYFDQFLKNSISFERLGSTDSCLLQRIMEAHIKPSQENLNLQICQNVCPNPSKLTIFDKKQVFQLKSLLKCKLLVQKWVLIWQNYWWLRLSYSSQQISLWFRRQINDNKSLCSYL